MQIVLDAFGGMRNGVEMTTHYRFYWSPTLVLLWPFLAATHSLWVLQAILAGATVACAPLLAAIARARGLERGLADRIGGVALVYPPLIAVGFGEFRDLGLLPALALGWWLALQRRSWGWVAACAVLLAGLREDVCIELAIAGVVVAIAGARGRDRALIAAGLDPPRSESSRTRSTRSWCCRASDRGRHRTSTSIRSRRGPRRCCLRRSRTRSLSAPQS